MNSLVHLALDAHGGLERWRMFEDVSAHLRNDDALWALKHQQGVIDVVNLRVAPRREFTVFPDDDLFGAPETWARPAFPSLFYFREVDRGGHFPACEHPNCSRRSCARLSNPCGSTRLSPLRKRAFRSH